MKKKVLVRLENSKLSWSEQVSKGKGGRDVRSEKSKKRKKGGRKLFRLQV